jgi:hypothetical protein
MQRHASNSISAVVDLSAKDGIFRITWLSIHTHSSLVPTLELSPPATVCLARSDALNVAEDTLRVLLPKRERYPRLPFDHSFGHIERLLISLCSPIPWERRGGGMKRYLIAKIFFSSGIPG